MADTAPVIASSPARGDAPLSRGRASSDVAQQRRSTDLLDPAGLMLFLAIAEAGSLKAAARSLNTVQSNVTQRLKGFERRIGIPLFVRHPGGVRPTDAGYRLLPHAAALRRLMQSATETLSGDETACGPLTLGAMETTAAMRLPGLLTAYARRHPQVDIALRTGPTHWLVKEIVAGRIEGGFVDGPVNRPDIVTRNVFSEQLGLISSRENPPPAQSDTPPRIVVFRGACSYRARLEAYLDGHGIGHRGLLEFGSLDGLLSCVAAGLGVSMLPQEVLRHSAFADRIDFHDIGESGRATTVFAMRTDGFQSSALRAFLLDLDESTDLEAHPPATR